MDHRVIGHDDVEALDVIGASAEHTMHLDRRGGFGLSGFGKEHGPEGLAEFQRVKTVALG